jgi:intracellular multiplication protein IcmO
MDLESGEEVWVSTGDVNKHALMIGTTGSGKTEAIMGHVAGFLALGSGALIVDGKASANTFDSTYKISRFLGRDADLFVMDYMTGGKDIVGPQQHRRSHSYNPLGFGGSAQKSEVMISLLDGGGDADIWKGKAIQFLEGLIPPLSFLSEQGFMLLNPSLIGQFLNLNVLENFANFGIIQDLNGKIVWLPEEYPAVWNALQVRMNGLRLYLDNVPGFNISRNNEPIFISGMDAAEFEAITPRVIEKRNKALEAPGDKQARSKTEEQHGYITMQLTRSIGTLKDSYGFIYNAEIGEISFSDVVLNRRSLVVLLPSLERSPANLSMLGKMTVLSVKAVLGSLLQTAPEGSRRRIIEGNPSNSTIPYAAIFDEIGYYIVEGVSVIPAQARSLGVAVYFGTQDIPSLSKGSEAEGKAILENTALKMIGRIASDQESETARTARELAGKVSTQVASRMEFKRDALGVHNQLRLSDDSSLDEEYRINYADLTKQENGEFHTILGTKEFDHRGKESGGQRLTRLLSFFTGVIPNVENWRRNPYVQIKAPSVAEISQMRETERAERRFRTRLADILVDLPVSPVDPTRPTGKDGLVTALWIAQRSLIGRYLEWRRAEVVADRWDGSDPRANAERVREWMRTQEADEKVRRTLVVAAKKTERMLEQARKVRQLMDKPQDALLPGVIGAWKDAFWADQIQVLVESAPEARDLTAYQDDDAISPYIEDYSGYWVGATRRVHGEGAQRGVVEHEAMMEVATMQRFAHDAGVQLFGDESR